MSKRVIVVGAGGREHALAWRLREEGVEVFLAPGNGGSQALGEVLEVPLPVDADSVAAFVSRVKAFAPDLVVVGPEAPLVAGIVDALQEAGVAAFGPNRAAAQLEGSKAFSKRFMARHAIPTAAFEVVTDVETACHCLERQQAARPGDPPWVVKADGLAAGKGVVVPETLEEAKAAVQRLLGERSLGDAGAKLVLEARLPGQEVSYHVIADGERYLALAPAQDHKRLKDGDRGPNTGGMGAYTPPPIVDAAIEAHIRKDIIEPTLNGMRDEGTPFRGALFVGLMIHDGRAQVLEYNVRFGDPECECLMARLGGSLFELLDGSARGALQRTDAEWRAAAAMSVVLASPGYPGAYEKNLPIDGLGDAEAVDGAWVFHAGTKRAGDGSMRTAGGRVLAVTATGDSVVEARNVAYDAAERISFPGVQFRRDIGHHALDD